MQKVAQIGFGAAAGVLLAAVSMWGSSNSSSATTLPAPQRETLLPGYCRSADGILFDFNYPEYRVEREVAEGLPPGWARTLSADSELSSWLADKVRRGTEDAHNLGVVGFQDREAFWANRVARIRAMYRLEISDRYKIVPISEGGLDLPPLE